MKVDTSKIDGYETMSAEEKLRALEAYEFEAPKADTSELNRLKAALDKATSEAAANKRALRERQTDEEAKAAAAQEELDSMKQELESLRADRTMGQHKASYMEIGYDAETAEANAKALMSGDFATVFANEKRFIEAQKKAALAGAINNQPNLSAGNPPSIQKEPDELAAFRKAAGL